MAAKPDSALKTALGVAGAILGLGAYVYLLGGFVLWLKFTAARLPADDAVGALGGNRLLAVGLKALVFELVLVGILLGLALLAWEGARFFDVQEAKKKNKNLAKAAELDLVEKWDTWRKLLQALIAGILAAAMLAKALHWAHSTFPWPILCIAVGIVVAALWPTAVLPRLLARGKKLGMSRRALKTLLTIIAAGLAVAFFAAPLGVGILVLLLFLHLSHYLKELHKVPDAAHLIPAVLIVAGGLSLVVATYLATPPVSLDSARVVMAGKRHEARGGYVGRSGDGVSLAACVPKSDDPTESGTMHLRVLAPDRIRRVVLGGKSDYVLDYGNDPSLLDVGRYLVSSRDSIGELTDTVSFDARDTELTCGFPRELTIGKRERDEQTGRLTQATTVPDDGVLTLSGDDLVGRQLEPNTAGSPTLPIALKPAVRMEHRCEGPFKTLVKVSFEHGDDKPETKETTVTVTSATGSNRLEAAQACHRAWVHQRIAPLRPTPRSNAR